MFVLQVYCKILMIMTFRSPSGADEEDSGCLFVSHLTGQDSPQCGSSVAPCRTLPQALLLVHDGGKICLDGRESESHPYGCLRIDGPNGVQRTLINKSVSIQGSFSKAHISCEHCDSLAFGTHARNSSLKVTLSNLVFDNTGVLIFNVCSFNVVVSKCRFMNCPVGVGMRQEESSAHACQKSTLEVTDSEFWYNKKSIFVFLFNEFFNLTISRCLFQGKKGQFKIATEARNTTGAVHVWSIIQLKKRFRTHTCITDSIFREIGHDDNNFALVVNIHDIFSTGYVSLLNTSFVNNENGILVVGGIDLRLTEVTIDSTFSNAFIGVGCPKVARKVVGLKVFLDRCILVNNRVGIKMATTSCLKGLRSKGLRSCSASDQTLVVRNSIFLGGPKTRSIDYAIRFFAENNKKNDEPFRKEFDFEVHVRLQNVTFQGLHDCALSVGTDKNAYGLILVKNCKFLNNHQFVYRLDERATVQIEFKNDDPPKCPRKREGDANGQFAWNEKSRLPVIFEDTTFEGNVGISGALNLLNGNVTFKNCTFKNNEGVTMGGHVYMKTGYGSLNIVNSTFLQTSLKRRSDVSSYGCFLRSESAGPLIIKNSSFTANINRKFYPIFATTKSSSINIDKLSSLRCPTGKQINFEKITKRDGFDLVKGSDACWIKVNYIKLFCEACFDGFYTLQRGSTNGLDVNKDTECLKCPHGATCEDGRILAKENFWGFNISARPPSLKFIPCPLEYCNTPKHSYHYTYNGCHGSRSGVLCGQCSDGYSEVLYSTSCRKKEKCIDHWFWLASFIYVVLFAIYVVFKPPIFSLLYRQSLWFRKKPEASPNEDSSDEHDAGYLKIIFYFYQVAELVMIKSPENALHMVPFITPVMALFNFQVKTMNGSIGCPFPGLNVVTKELFMCLKFLATLASIASIYAIHRGISKTWYTSTPSLPLYLAVALETLLLGYETLADTTLKLMHCVPIGLEWRLFVDGNIQCWQWWQYLLIVFIVVFVIPLVLVLFWGSLMLSKDKVSAKEFLTSCAFPLPFLFIWLFRYCKKRPNANQFGLPRRNSNDTEEIKKVLHDPFRPASDDDHGTLYWESVLTGRRLILLTIHTFATDPMIRFVCLDCACLVIMLHHLASRPFRDRKANIFESLSLVSLVVICTFNLAEITYISEGIEPTGPNENLFHVLLWIEIVLLGLLPAVACMLVVFAALSQVVRVLYHFVRVLSDVMHKAMPRCLSSRPRQLVLINWDPDEELYSVA